jgi:hypothetical protein
VRTVERKRHHVRPLLITLLKPVMRYSYSRDAYVLRAIGQEHGPVLKARTAATARQPQDSGPR